MFRVVVVRMAGTVVFIIAGRDEVIVVRGRSKVGDLTAAEKLRRKQRLMSKVTSV